MSDNISATDFDFEANRLNDLASQQHQKLDHQLHVQFYPHAELNSFRTRAEGRKIFDEKVYIRILAPANRLNVVEREATDDDKLRFARQYKQYLDNAEQLQSGTPLSELPSITQAQVLELKHLKVETVEQLAGVADGTAQLLGTGGMELKMRAQRYLDRTANNEELATTVRAQAAQIAELKKLIEERTAAAAPDSGVKVNNTEVK